MLLQPVRSTQLAYGSEFYELSDEYDSSVTGFSGDFEYYGYINPLGKWVIVQHQISVGTWRYVNGAEDYLTAWGMNGSLSYGLYNTMSNLTP